MDFCRIFAITPNLKRGGLNVETDFVCNGAWRYCRRVLSGAQAGDKPEGMGKWELSKSSRDGYICTDPAEVSSEITWADRCAGGKPVGTGVERYADGTVAEGPKVDGKMNGYWILRYTDGMVAESPYRDIRLFDFPRWAQPLRDEIRDNAQRLACEANLDIEFIRSHKAFRKEQRIKDIVKERGEHPGLVHIFSAMETCASFRPWHDKKTHRTSLKPSTSKCLHYYFYFIDEAFGLCYVRVPTWAPFRLQVYFNGHHWLAHRLDQAGIAYEKADNAFPLVSDFRKAQRLADRLDARQIHRHLKRWAKRFCPLLRRFRSGYHWSFMQAEYATDVLFHRQSDFQPRYDNIVRTAVHSVQADQVATFLGHKLTGAWQGEAGNDFSTRIQGTRIRHRMGPTGIKLYDKLGIMARVECTTNDVSFFKTHRVVQQRDGSEVWKLAPLRKNSLRDVRRMMQAANERYLAFIAAIDNPNAGLKAIDKLARPVKDGGRSYRGFNLFLGDDHRLFLTLARGEWCISGFRAVDLRTHLPGITPSRCSSLLKRLRMHGLIKKVGRRYKYYLTVLGRRILASALNIRESIVLPSLCEAGV